MQRGVMLGEESKEETPKNRLSILYMYNKLYIIVVVM